MKIAYQFILCLLLLGCNSKSEEPPRTVVSDSRDTIAKNLLLKYDSLSDINRTTDDKAALLKAYLENDTGYLQEVNDRMRNELFMGNFYIRLHKCVDSKNITDLNYEEAYRFEYKRAFCPIITFLTIGRTELIYELDAVSVEYDYRDSICEEKSRHTITLTKKQWNDFKNELDSVDFWGLKYRNGKEGTDGSSLYITEIHHNTKMNSIYRWSPENLAIGKVFFNLYKTSGIYVDCYLFEYRNLKSWNAAKAYE